MCFLCRCMIFGLQRIIKNIRPVIFDIQPVIPTKQEAIPRPVVGSIRSPTEPSGARGWLKHCATSQKVEGSIPDVVIEFFH